MTTSLLPDFPDIEEVLMAFCDSLVVQRPFSAGSLHLVGRTYTVWPDLEGAEYPLLRVERIGGPTTRLKDYPRFDLEVLAPGTEGKFYLRQIETELFSYPGAVAVDSQVVKFENVSVPTSIRRLPWEDDRVRRYAATYQITVSRS